MLETRQTSVATRRRRQCLNPRCNWRFTTSEAPASQVVASVDEIAMRARLLAREFGAGVKDKDALEAALAVDMRRAAISRAARADRRAQRDTWYDNDTDAAPERLDLAQLRRVNW